jgi:hypothetical protein
VPSANVIRFTAEGGVVAEGPINADGPEVTAAAQLLDDLLSGLDAPPEFRTPGGLRIAVARALGTLDLPPFPSLEEFCAAIERFAAPDLATVARELFVAGTKAVEARRGAPAEVEPLPTLQLTISDVRRARRATGLSLDEVSDRSRIPTPLLRELEWGYFRNWPGGLYGRSQLVRYARAAGLDEALVIEVALPMIEEAREGQSEIVTDITPAERPIEALVPVGKQALEIIPDLPLTSPVASEPIAKVRVRKPRRRRFRIALAAAAVLALAIVPAVWEYQRYEEETTSTVASDVEPSPSSIAPAPQPASAAADRVLAEDKSPSAPSKQVVPDGVLPTLTSQTTTRVGAQPAGFVPAFSNTGTAVFYNDEAGAGSALISGDRTQPGAILKITRIVDDKAQNFHARPSPDGSRIAFDSDRDGTRAVFVADADGQHVRRVSGDGFAALPSWAPNSQALAFVKAEPDKPRVWNLWTADLDDGQLRQITSYPDGQPWGGSWFPDGHRLAYGHESQLVVLDVQTGVRQTQPAPVRGHLVRSPAVSPDGRYVIFQVVRDGVWLLDTRNGSMRRVLDDPTAEEYSWSPDGRRVAFHSLRANGWGVWVLSQ